MAPVASWVLALNPAIAAISTINPKTVLPMIPPQTYRRPTADGKRRLSAQLEARPGREMAFDGGDVTKVDEGRSMHAHERAARQPRFPLPKSAMDQPRPTVNRADARVIAFRRDARDRRCAYELFAAAVTKQQPVVVGETIGQRDPPFRTARCRGRRYGVAGAHTSYRQG